MNMNRLQCIAKKKSLFEYFVFKIEEWRKECGPQYSDALTKLRLQKILFLAAAVNAQYEKHVLLDVFDSFHALPYGPVEMDIYDAMNTNSFENIRFNGNNCELLGINNDCWDTIDANLREEIDLAIKMLREIRIDYPWISVFSLVDITHRWSAWKVAMEFADIIGAKSARLTTDDILTSSKYF